MASFLPALASFFNPGNIIKGLGATVTGVLDNISKGQGLDISGNLSKGIKTALASDEGPTPPNEGKSIIGSTGGNHAFERGYTPSLGYPENQASNINMQRMADLNTRIPPIKNATSYRPAYVDNYGRAGVYKDNALAPTSFPGATPEHGRNQPDIETVSTAPAGLPSFEKNVRNYNIGRVDRAKEPNPPEKIVLRDIYGYKGQKKSSELKETPITHAKKKQVARKPIRELKIKKVKKRSR